MTCEWSGLLPVTYDQYIIGRHSFGVDDDLPERVQIGKSGMLVYTHRHTASVHLAIRVEDSGPEDLRDAVKVDVSGPGWTVKVPSDLGETLDGPVIPAGRWWLVLERRGYDAEEVIDHHVLRLYPR